MKKLTLFLCFIASTIECFSQADIAGIFGHQRTAGRYCGWSPTVPGSIAGSFDLRNDFLGQPINFFTGGAQRMTILGSGGSTPGYVGISTAAPRFPLTVVGDGNSFVTTNGWRRGILLQNHAVLAWFDTLQGNAVFMGHPSFNVDHSFLCGLASDITPNSVPNYVYRIINVPTPGLPPNSGDFEFLTGTNNHNVLMDHYLGIGPAPANYNPSNRIQVTTAVGDPYFGNPAGSSGIRLTNMIAGVNTLANPGSGVISVDNQGNLIYVPGGGTVNAANNGISISTVNANTVVLGNNVGATTG